MRTAEEIIDEQLGLDTPSDGWNTTYSKNDVVILINEARIEAIKSVVLK